MVLTIEDSVTSRMRFLVMAASLVVVAIIVWVLHNSAALFIPLVLAIVLWFILITIASYYQRIKIFDTNIPYGIALLLAILTVLFFFFLLIEIIRDNVSEFLVSLPVYQEKLRALTNVVEKIPLVRKAGLDELSSQINISAVAAAVVGEILSRIQLFSSAKPN